MRRRSTVTIAGSFTHKHFTYKGVVHNVDTTLPPIKKNRLLPQLRVEMDEYLRDLNELNTRELPFVLGFINQVLNSSASIEDYLRVLPESLHQPLRDLKSTCPCRTMHLTEDKVTLLKEKNQEPINLMCSRLAANLLI